MKLMKLSVKNVSQVFWRSFTIGLFIFFLGFLIVFFSSFTTTAKERMENAVINAFSGHLALAPASSTETDLADMMKTAYGDLPHFTEGQMAEIASVLSRCDGLEYTGRIRQNALLISDADYVPAMTVGIDPRLESYKNAVTILQGRYLDPNASHEIILTGKQAQQLRVTVGETLGVLSQTIDGYSVDSALTVVGIAEITFVSTFGLTVSYIDLASAREMIGFSEGEATDVLIYLDDKGNTDRYREKLKSDFLFTAGLPNADDVLTVKIQDYRNMGGFFRSAVEGGTAVFTILIVFLLLIVSILIVNLIFMIGMERFEEIGTLRALGFSRWSVIRIFLGEIFLITLVFGLAGILAGTGAVLLFSQVGLPSPSASFNFIMGEKMFMKFQVTDVLAAAAVVFIFPLFAAFWPSRRAASIRPAQALRAE